METLEKIELLDLTLEDLNDTQIDLLSNVKDQDNSMKNGQRCRCACGKCGGGKCGNVELIPNLDN